MELLGDLDPDPPSVDCLLCDRPAEDASGLCRGCRIALGTRR